ncbi:SphA family protein [Desulfarculus baarsii]
MINAIKKMALGVAAAALVLAASGAAMAFGHYTPGALGLGAATLPPPGFHYTIYNIFYNADTMIDDNGNESNVGLDLNVFASAHQFTYMTDYKFLGAEFGFDMIVPLVSTNIEIRAAGVDDSQFGIGDLYFEPFVLAWRKPQWDVAFALGFYAPTADSGGSASPGLGYWSFMETLGATYYFDQARTWSVSLLTRWLQNTESRDSDVTQGANVVAEYGAGKTIPLSRDLLFQFGVSGYTNLQLTDNSGTTNDDVRARSNAVGPEIHFTLLKPLVLQAYLRYLFEYGTEATSEGQTLCLTLIGSF